LIGPAHQIDVTDVSVDAARHLGDGQRREHFLVLRAAVAQRQRRNETKQDNAHKARRPFCPLVKVGRPNCSARKETAENRQLLFHDGLSPHCSMRRQPDSPCLTPCSQFRSSNSIKSSRSRCGARDRKSNLLVPEELPKLFSASDFMSNGE
jgi:hypothetical protein